MKSVLISIQPKWCEKIASGEKTIEVRKSRPKIDTPFKVYIYCTNTKPYLVWGDVFRGNWETEFTHLSGYNRKDAEKIWDVFNGKVIGEFVCDKIVQFENSLYDEVLRETVTRSCVPMYDLLVYLGKQDYGYGWHISDLVIYDKPKELSSFIVPSKTGCVNEGKCRGCIYLDRGNGYNIEDDCNAKFCTDEYKPLRRPPQSWCYVEEVNGNG